VHDDGRCGRRDGYDAVARHAVEGARRRWCCAGVAAVTVVWPVAAKTWLAAPIGGEVVDLPLQVVDGAHEHIDGGGRGHGRVLHRRARRGRNAVRRWRCCRWWGRRSRSNGGAGRSQHQARRI
jgi:hypothetical protein